MKRASALVVLAYATGCSTFGEATPVDAGDAGLDGAPVDGGATPLLSEGFEGSCGVLETNNSTASSVPAGGGRQGQACRVCRAVGSQYFNVFVIDAPLVAPGASYEIEVWLRSDSGVVPRTTIAVETTDIDVDISGGVALGPSWAKAAFVHRVPPKAKEEAIQIRFDATPASSESCVVVDDLVVRPRG